MKKMLLFSNCFKKAFRVDYQNHQEKRSNPIKEQTRPFLELFNVLGSFQDRPRDLQDAKIVVPSMPITPMATRNL